MEIQDMRLHYLIGHFDMKFNFFKEYKLLIIMKQ